jgi:alpha-tubulin suppressor-like RCC1 family protein
MIKQIKQHSLLTLLLLFGVWPGVSTTRAATADAVVVWGNNRAGQTTVSLTAQSEVMAMAAGGSHSVALKTDGSVVAWGAGNANTGNYPDYGQSGVPVGLSGVTAIAAGGDHTVALKTDGSVVAWGWNYYGQTTVPLEAQSGVMAIAAGELHTVALKTDGSVVAWGDNDYGQTTVPLGREAA